MRIIITSAIPLDSFGGGITHLLEIAAHLQQSGVEVYLMPVTDEETPAEIWPKERLIEVRPSHIHHLLDGLGIVKAIQRFVVNREVDAVLGWHYEVAFVPYLAGRYDFLFGVIAAFPYRTWGKRKSNFRWLKKIADNRFRYRPLRKADIVFCPSEFACQEIIELFNIPKKKIVIAPLGVNSDFFDIPRKPDNSINRLIFFGSLEPIKGVYDAIKALGIVKQKGFSNWTFKVAGWGSREALINLAQQYRIEGQINFLGGLKRAELIKELAWAQVAILPSHTESFGLAIAEAQASGLPVISYQTGAVPEIVKHNETGALSPLGDVSDLAKNIIASFDDPMHFYQMGEAGREAVRAGFNWEKTARTVLNALIRLRSELE